MFIVLNTDGTIERIDQPATSAAIREAVGDPGFDLFAVPEKFPASSSRSLYAFVNDEGFRLGLPRNPIGAMTLALLGSQPRILAGPIVVTGWESPSDRDEIRDLTPGQVSAVTEHHRLVRGAVDGTIVGEDDWTAVVREAVGYVRNAPSPLMRVMSLDEYLDSTEGVKA